MKEEGIIKRRKIKDICQKRTKNKITELKKITEKKWIKRKNLRERKDKNNEVKIEREKDYTK